MTVAQAPRRRRLRGALIAALLSGVPGALAQGLTLAQAQATALRHNSDVRTAEASLDAAIAQLRVAREYPNPTLSLSTSKISTDGVASGTPLGNGLFARSYDSIISLSQLLPVAKRGLERDAAVAGVRMAQFQREDVRRIVAQAVTQAYAAALAARDEADVLQSSAAKLRKEAELAAHRERVGDLSRSDQSQLEIAADQEELGAASQRASARAAVVTLEILIGLASPSGDTELADSLDGCFAQIPPQLGASQVGTRPDIAAAEAALAQADANLSLARRQRLPDVTASVQYERNPASQPDTVGVGLSVPLPVWDQFGGEILAGKAAREQAQAQLDRVRAQASADVANARSAFGEAYERALRYEASLVPKSAEVERSVAYAYERGGGSLLDLLEAERNDNLIRLGWAQAKADAASAAVALQAALGAAPGDSPSTPTQAP